MNKLLVSSLVLIASAASAAWVRAWPTVGPDYQRPTVDAPARFAGAPDADAPASSLSPDWWRSFGDPVLDELEHRALQHNQDLAAAFARVEQARALAGAARADYLPSLALDAAAERARTSRNVANPLSESPATTYRAPFVLSWELDLAGRVRRLNESVRAEWQSAAATFAGVQLALTAEVARSYFQLHALQEESTIVANTATLRREALTLMQSRLARGVAAELDVARAETALALAEADAAELDHRVATTRHALAVLVGAPAPTFKFAASAATTRQAPTVPVGLPSELLSRRPDLAAAERALAAANARVGVAQAAFFPAISLTGAAGFTSAELDDLVDRDSRIWSIAPRVYLPIFQGGRNRANLARARAAHDEALASYQQRVLIAFREVQDALTAAQRLAEQSRAQERAVASARRGAELSQRRYAAGFVNYLEVVDAERTALEVDRTAAQLAGRRWINHVALIKALGGGWTMPTDDPSRVAAK